MAHLSVDNETIFVGAGHDSHQPTQQVLDLVVPFATEFHNVCEEERKSSTGLHDIHTIELTYRFTMQVGAAIILAADATDDPV